MACLSAVRRIPPPIAEVRRAFFIGVGTVVNWIGSIVKDVMDDDFGLG